MVTIAFSQKLVRVLELHLLKQADYQLPLPGFSLVLLIPTDPNSWSENKTLLISAKGFDLNSRWELTYAFLQALREGLTKEEYLSIFNLDFIEPEANVVTRVQAYLTSREDGTYEVPIGLIGGVSNQLITAFKSTVLEKLAVGNHLLVELNDDSPIVGKIQRIAPVENDAEVFVQTPDGLRTCSFTSIKKVGAAVRSTGFSTPLS